MKITILGGGSMGIAMAALLSGNGNDISIWTPFIEEVEQINKERGIPDRLPDIRLSQSVMALNDLEDAVNNTQMAVVTVPSVFMRETAVKLSNVLNKYKYNIPIVCCSKGLENDTGCFLSEILEQEIRDCPVLVLSGPSYAIEIAGGMPTAVVVASRDKGLAEYCQNVFMNESFRVYTSCDVKGVELGGALKNIIALCAGISDGLGYGDDSKAALLTRGIAEIARLGVAMGAKSQTFFGLTGIGDIILTCTGKYSRNKQTGILLGKGYKLEDALAEVKMVVEGVNAAKPALLLSEKYSVEMPIIREANLILFEGHDPKEAVLRLMKRDKKDEF